MGNPVEVAARASAREIIDAGKDGIWTELTDEAEVELRKDMRDWLEAIK